MVFALNQSENIASYKGKMVKLSVVRVHGIKTLSVGRQPALKNFFMKGVEYLIHDIAKQHLVKKYGYPENVANIVYDPHFPIRGEWSNKWEDDFHSFALAPFVVCL